MDLDDLVLNINKSNFSILLYSGYFNYDNENNVFFYLSNFFYLTDCELPNVFFILIIKTNIKNF